MLETVFSTVVRSVGGYVTVSDGDCANICENRYAVNWSWMTSVVTFVN